MRKTLLIVLLVVLAIAIGLTLGVAFAPRVGEANCHGFSPQLPSLEQDRGSPINPLRCKPDGLGGMKCSYLY